jgi:hypothetical protein
MHTLGLALADAWKVLAVGLLLGAGLPMLFAVGIRSLAWGEGGAATGGDGTTARAANPLGKPLAVVCFAVVVLAVALGITVIVSSGFGKVVSFEHVYPSLTDKA